MADDNSPIEEDPLEWLKDLEAETRSLLELDIDEDQALIVLAHAKDLLKIWIETAHLDNEEVKMLKDELARVEEEREQLKHLNALQAAKLGEIVNVEAQLDFLRIQVDRGKRECEHLQLLNSLQAAKQRQKKNEEEERRGRLVRKVAKHALHVVHRRSFLRVFKQWYELCCATKVHQLALHQHSQQQEKEQQDASHACAPHTPPATSPPRPLALLHVPVRVAQLEAEVAMLQEEVREAETEAAYLQGRLEEALQNAQTVQTVAAEAQARADAALERMEEEMAGLQDTLAEAQQHQLREATSSRCREFQVLRQQLQACEMQLMGARQEEATKRDEAHSLRDHIEHLQKKIELVHHTNYGATASEVSHEKTPDDMTHMRHTLKQLLYLIYDGPHALAKHGCLRCIKHDAQDAGQVEKYVFEPSNCGDSTGEMSSDGEQGMLGVEFSSIGVVIDIAPGSPADESGLIKVGDHLLELDGQPILFEEFTSLLAGRVGSSVSLLLKEDTRSGERCGGGGVAQSDTWRVQLTRASKTSLMINRRSLAEDVDWIATFVRSLVPVR